MAEDIDPNQDVDISEGKWLKHPLLPETGLNYDEEINAVLNSWKGAFFFTEEDLKQNRLGLRKPQLGALHAIQAHWSTSSTAATIVMPTGTGKTETMLSILVSTLCRCLLVVVPTDVLRTQIADKFLTLGILKDPASAVLATRAKHPIVGTLLHVPNSIEDVDSMFSRCHVVVTTSSIAGRCGRAIQDRMVSHCHYLFIDEAHHVEAPTWKAFKDRFQKRRVVQFTATPFREDGKPLDGKIVYRYPLKKAQEEGYFTRINFKRVMEFNPKLSDDAIATKAIEQLRADEDKGHILMARVGSIERAKEVMEVYKQYGQFKPVELHTGIKSRRQRELIREQILVGESRIIVCVDMLGEGFDLPELKIAAFHDIRKSLSVTLQLAGRFTRSKPDLGDATFIANTADIHVREELRKLYFRDPDWNVLLPELSDEIVESQQSLQEFMAGFTEFPDEISLVTVRPAISTVVYKTSCTDWTPDNFSRGIPSFGSCSEVYKSINEREHTIVVITAKRSFPDWSDLDNVFSWQWELYVIIWSPDQNLLFINSSSNSGEYKALAKAIGGEDAELIEGQQVFRSFYGINRLRLQNVGLSEQLGRNIRYTARMGADVESGLSELHRQQTLKTVLVGAGFEGGKRVTIGASRKGRIWSHSRNRIDVLAAWCKMVGSKLIDAEIDPDDVLSGTLNATTINERPAKMPIACDWPEEMYKTPEVMWAFIINGEEYLFSNLDISIVDTPLSGSLTFALVSDTEQIEIELVFYEGDNGPDYRFKLPHGRTVMIRRGNSESPLIDFFYGEPPIFWFSDGSSLAGNKYVELNKPILPYDQKKIIPWDWTGVDIRKESQGETKDQDSIQARVIQQLKRGDYDMIVDDDGNGEAADIVSIRIVEAQGKPKSIDVEFYHCKYSHGSLPGSRISDLYEVCGQAQKSIAWMFSGEKQVDLFTHLLRREAGRVDRGRASRYEVGDEALLLSIREMCDLDQCSMNLKIYVVQPGVSKQNVSTQQLHLMGVTANYLHETYQLPFCVIASP
ncbi:MAG: DEAD/DEAH box helicase family protein [Candidatus Poribacteria bacterium]|nr:DEAD/DEAH box helicase family protein [Candidatus Poribacteria bacterium]